MSAWRRALAFLTVLAVSLPGARGGAQESGGPAYVAVAEDAVLDQEEHPHHTAIHVSFLKSGTEWLPISLPPARMSWSVCFDGRRLAALDSRLPEKPPEARRFQAAHEPEPGQKVPFVGKPSAQFAGWMGGEVYRPLVMTSTASCGDPEHWRPAAPPAAVVKKLVPAMREAAKDIYDCDSSGSQRPYTYRDTDIRPGKGYVSDAGTRIISLAIRLPDDLAARCGVISGPGWQPHTFVVFSNGKVEHLGFGMTVLDAGDYDGDGRSEVLFEFGSYNSDGFALAYDAFRKTVRYEWSYH